VVGEILAGVSALAGLASLLGDEGDTPEIETKKIGRFNPEQEALFNEFMSQLNARMREPYALTPTKEELGYMSFLGGYEDWYKDLINQAYNTEATRKYWEETLLPQFERTTMPKIQAAFAGPGYWGSARSRAIGEAYTQFGEDEAKALYELEGKKGAALMELGKTLPVLKEALANKSRMFAPTDPLLSPYGTLAMQAFNVDPYYIVGGVQQPAGSPFGTFLSGMAPIAGAYLGYEQTKDLYSSLGLLGLGKEGTK